MRPWIVRGAIAIAAVVTIGALLNLAVSAWVWHRLDLGPLPASPYPPIPIDSLSATSCGPCHPSQYKLWSESRMGQASTEPVFLADWEHEGRNVLCLSCHAPLLEQHQRLPVGLWSVRPLWVMTQDNEAFQEGLADEGVTCVVCHLRDEPVIVGPNGAGSVHPTRRDPDFRGPKRCVRCHQVERPPLSNLDRPLADTHREWDAWRSVTGREDTCVDCHMPDGDHSFPGAYDAELLRGGLDIQVRRQGDVTEVALHNLAGHRFPSADPARALVVRVGDQEQVLARLVPLPRYIDMGDTTLAPDETRRLTFHGAGAQATVTVAMQPRRFLPNTPSRDEVVIAAGL